MVVDCAGGNISLLRRVPFSRRGKLFLISLTSDGILVNNPTLTSAIQYCAPKARVCKPTCIALALSNGREFRYLDDRQMGFVYYVTESQLGQVPRLDEQGRTCWRSSRSTSFRSAYGPSVARSKGC